MESLLADNLAGNISAEDMRTVLLELIRKTGGHVFYPNNTVTKQSILADTWTELNFDNTSPAKATVDAPYYLTQDLISGTGKFDFSELDQGSMLHNRLQYELITSGQNTEVKLRGRVYDVGDNLILTFVFDNQFYKTATTHTIATHLMTFINASNVGGYAYFDVWSDNAIDICWIQALIAINA